MGRDGLAYLGIMLLRCSLYNAFGSTVLHVHKSV
jgi:hypothetical protein